MADPKIVAFPTPEKAAASSSRVNPANMRADLVEKASKVIPHIPVLINMVSARVRQLNQGRAPLIRVMGRMGAADIALSEIIEGKVVLEEDQETEG